MKYFTKNLKGGHFLSTTAPKVHPLLHTCAESRRLLMKKHGLVHVFGALFNLNRDILFLDASTAIHHAEVNNPGLEAFAELLRHPRLIGKIKRLAFHVKTWYPFKSRDDYDWITKISERIKGQLMAVRELYFVVSIFSYFEMHAASLNVRELLRPVEVRAVDSAKQTWCI
jgi:hypothetical protein